MERQEEAKRELDQLKSAVKVPVAVFLAEFVSLEFITVDVDSAKATSSTCGITATPTFCVCRREVDVTKIRRN